MSVIPSTAVLIDIASGKPITKVPFKQTFDTIQSRLTSDEFDGVVDRINELIDDAGKEIATAGWLPGSDWYGTPFCPSTRRPLVGTRTWQRGCSG